MDKEIKRLLKLSKISGFKLLKKEEQKLEEWKKGQKPVKVKKPRRVRAKKGYTTMAGMGAGDVVSSVPTKSIKKKTNQVKKEEKEIGEIEES